MYSFSVNFEATTTSRAIWPVEKLRLTTSNTFTAYTASRKRQTLKINCSMSEVDSQMKTYKRG